MIKIYNFLLVSIVVLGMFFLSSCSEKHSLPSDAEVHQRFIDNFSDFEKVKNKIITEKIYRMEVFKEELTVRPEDIKLTANEKIELIDLLTSRLNTEVVNTTVSGSIIGGKYDIDNIRFVIFRAGLVTGGQSKGIIFMQSLPDEKYILDNLDSDSLKLFYQAGQLVSGQMLYTKIQQKEGWYIYYRST